MRARPRQPPPRRQTQILDVDRLHDSTLPPPNLLGRSARVEIPLARLTAGRFVADARLVNGAREVGRISRPFTYEP